MLRQSEIREAALLMIRRRGKCAADQATERARLLQTEGDADAARIWRRVANEIGRIEREEREVYAGSLVLFDTKYAGHEAI